VELAMNHTAAPQLLAPRTRSTASSNWLID
jgi:hypothetical protein